MAGVGTAIITTHQADVRTTAESLADGQMEAIKSGPYETATGGIGDYTSTIPTTTPAGYMFSTLGGSTNDGHIYGIPWDVTSDSAWSGTGDPGIQKVTIIVKSSAESGSQGVYKTIFTLTDFKVNR